MLVPSILGVVSAAPDVALEFLRRWVRHGRTANPVPPPRLLMDLRPGAGGLAQAAAALRQAGATLLAVLDDDALVEAEQAAARAGIPLLDPVAVTIGAAVRVLAGRGTALLLAGPDAALAALYQAEASRRGLDILLPERQARERLGQAIQLVQQGQLSQARPLALEAAVAEARRVAARGSDAAIVLASPALAAVLRPDDFTEPAVDCLEELARSAAGPAGA